MTDMTRPKFYDEEGTEKQVIGKDIDGNVEDITTENITAENLTANAIKLQSMNVNQNNLTIDSTGKLDSKANINTSEAVNCKTMKATEGINVNDKFKVDQNGNVSTNGTIKSVNSINVNDNFTVDNTGKVTAKEYNGDKSQIGNIIIEGNTITAVEEERVDISDYRLYKHVITLTNVNSNDDSCVNGTLFFTVYSQQETQYTQLGHIRFTAFSVYDTVGFPCTGSGRNAQAKTVYLFNYLSIGYAVGDTVVTVQSQQINLEQNTLNIPTLTLKNTYSIKDEVVRIL